MVILDTNVLLAAQKPGETPPHLDDLDDLRISCLSYAEMRIGLHTVTTVSAYEDRRARLEAIEQVFGKGLPFDDMCVGAYERVLQLVVRHGGDARANRFDRMIGATALAHGAILVTRNLADFRAMEGLITIIER